MKGLRSIDWLFFAGVFVVLALAFAALQYLDGNVRAFLWINQNAQVLGDTFWECVTVLGDGLVACLIVTPLVYKRPRVVLNFAISALVELGISQLVKLVVGSVPRPLVVLPPELVHYAGPAISSNGFPSGHAGMALALAGVLCLSSKSWLLRLTLLSGGLLIGLSRVAVGAHWPADVLAGAAIGWLAAGLGYLIAQWSPHGDLRITRVIFEIALLCGGVAIFFVDPSRYAAGIWLMRILGVAVIGLLIVFLYREFRPARAAENGNPG